MKLGLFMMPINDHRRDTNEVLREDVELAVLCDALGYEEIWVGEHYSTLSEPVSCPFIFLANLIARTARAKLATGVVNLPQRHPAQTAAHAALLDHLSAGRLILGVSPGGLASDFELFGLTDQKVRREMAAEAIELVLKLWTSEAPFDLRGKYWRISLTDHVYPEIGVGKMIRPYQLPHPPLVASAMSPNSLSSIAAGRRGWGLISANFIPAVNVATHWQGYVEGCRQAGRLPRPQDWRVARSIFVAEDDREAKAYVRNPEGPFAHYYGYLVTLVRRAGFDAVMRPVDETGDVVTPAYACDNLVIAGDPATVAAEILALREQIGDFGTLVATATDLQSPAHKERLHRSFELLAREVLPRVNAALERPQ